jgi:hypothetical protein
VGQARVSPGEAAGRAGEAVAVEVMGAVNVAIARLVDTIHALLATDGWCGAGLRSPEQWVCWKAGVSRGRAEGLVQVARRVGELPECWARFRAGCLGEDAMVRIARRVPHERDAEIAALAPRLLISQLDRILRALPEQPTGAEGPEPERALTLREGRGGWLHGRFCLPPDDAALVQVGLSAARDAEFRDRHDLAPHDVVDPATELGARRVGWADALVRMAATATDALDPTLERTGQRAERHLVVLHHDVDPHGVLGPGQLDLGPVVPQPVARYMACDAKVQAVIHRAGRLVGIHPTDRTVDRALRRYLARRDQGCTHPTCTQRRWLHAHHIAHWEDGGLTTPENLTLLCPFHHRALHHGAFTIDGDPEAGTLEFLDRHGTPIEAPGLDPPPDPPPGRPPDPDEGGPPDRPPPSPYTPPLGERLRSDTFTWN